MRARGAGGRRGRGGAATGAGNATAADARASTAPRRPAPGRYAEALYLDEGATLGDLREAATAFEDVVRISRRVLGGSHPVTTEVENDLQKAQAALYARGLP